jgi:outer membrane protein assembly factor BamC
MRKSVVVLILAGVLGCASDDGGLGERKVDYRSARKAVTGLEVPPDLTSPSVDNRYAVGEAAAAESATFSAYRTERGNAAAASPSTLPAAADKVRIERAGTQRWLVVKDTPERVAAAVREFWIELGFVIAVDTPETGIIETDWAENRAKIPESGIRKLLAKVLDFAYSAPERDKFRTRLERGSEAGSTEVYVSHRGVLEVVKNTRDGTTIWQARPSDTELEAEMLAKLLVRLGTEPARAKALLTAEAPPPRATITRGGNAADTLDMIDPFDQAWRRVGLALDRLGFTVEDRNRQQGLYFVRYVDDQREVAGEGFFDKLAFWRDDKETTARANQYRIQVRAIETRTRVEVLPGAASDKPVNAEASGKILALLHEQLR